MGTVLSLYHITVRHLDKTLFKNLSFKVNKGEHWALVGSSGSGKSALLQTIAGKFNITAGTIQHHYFDDFTHLHPNTGSFLTHHQLIGYVPAKHGFRNLSNTASFYYQQRYNSSDSEDAPTVEDYLTAIKPLAHRHVLWCYEQILGKFKLDALHDKQLIKLSNGETKRLLIAAALLKQPALLLLDNPLTGLDVQTRSEFNELVNEITAFGITVVMATSPTEIPDAITHVAVFRQGEIVASMPKADFDPAMIDIHDASTIDEAELGSLLSQIPVPRFNDIVNMRQVTVRYGEKLVLDQVDWHIKQGEHWALLGPNGAGKSTILSLINGDNPQAYANDIVLFDRKRGTGESIWDIKSKTGFVSPELHQYFPADNNCLQVIESGFYDTLGLFRLSQPQKATTAMRWARLLELENDASKPLKNVPASTQRLVLLARALVKNPPLLIFDEPCQGLDVRQQLHFKSLIDAICRLSKVTLIYVTHYEHEIPDCVSKVLKLTAPM